MPTLDYLTGFNHRTVSTVGGGLFSSFGGTTPTISSSVSRHTGGSSLRIPPLTSAVSNVAWTIPSTTSLVIVGYVFFETAMPTATMHLLKIGTSGLVVAGSGSHTFSERSTGLNVATGLNPITANTWYRFELSYDGAGATVSCSIGLGDNVADPDVLTGSSITGGAITSVLLGEDSSVTIANAVYFTDIAWSTQSADYPIGPTAVYGYTPNAVGTHNLDASTSTFFFTDTAAPPGGSTTAITTSETTSYQSIHDIPLDTGTDAVKVTLGGTPVQNTPSVRSVGTWSFTPNNVATPATLTPGAPAGKAVGDLLLLICESRSIVGTVATPTGWATVTNSPVRSGTASGGTIYYFTRIADGTATDTPSPVWASLGSTGTTGDASGAGIMAIQNAQAVLDATLVSQDLSAQGATSTITGVTTVTDKSIVVNVAMKLNEASGQTATVTNYTEQSDNSTTSGTGHIIETSSLVKTPLGASGSGTITWSATTSARALIASIALKATTVLSQPTNTWYTEYDFGDVASQVSATFNPYAARAIVAQELDTAVSSTWVAKLFDSLQGTNTEDVSNGSISSTTKTFVGKTFPGRPSTQTVYGTTTISAWNIDAGTGGGGSIIAAAQSLSGLTGYLVSFLLNVDKVLNPTDSLVVALQSDSAGLPSGVTLTSTTILGSSLQTFPAADITVGLSPYLLTGGTYWVVFTRSGATDTTNKYEISRGTPGITSYTQATSGGSWTGQADAGLRLAVNVESSWTLAAFNATRLRFGYTAAASGHPRLAAAMLEAAYNPNAVAQLISQPSNLSNFGML